MGKQRVTALTNVELLDQLCDRVVAKLREASIEQLPSKQWVVSSSLTRDALASEGVTASFEMTPPECSETKPTIRRARGLRMSLSDAITAAPAANTAATITPAIHQGTAAAAAVGGGVGVGVGVGVSVGVGAIVGVGVGVGSGGLAQESARLSSVRESAQNIP